MGGLVNVPLRAAYQEAVPADARGNGMAVMNTANYLCMTLLAALLFGLARLQIVSAAGQLWLLAALAIVGMLQAWRELLRDSLELVMEIVIWPMYRVHTYGPGRDQVPRRGPLLIIANHAAWLDPIWLGKVVPRSLTPLMTSIYYDRPVLHWLMTKAVRAIRVPASTFRREAPELKEAAAALDRGACVIIFPEGAMRRRSEQPLRQFGQGVWRLLSWRPATPVVVCWIEGGWGSLTSYKGGPPLVHKSLDWWRRIDIALEAPQVLDVALLSDQRATRTYLMNACLDARRHLGLERLALQPVAEGDGEDDSS
jgi:1-acyl-sn-glycerol-3-phosphate acyltransferase